MKSIEGFVVVLFALQLGAETINVSGSLPDLNGNGSSTDENNVVSYVAQVWGGLVNSNDTFQLAITAANLNGGTANGGIAAFNSAGDPIAGFVNVGTPLGGGFSWFVDPTPQSDSEFSNPVTPYLLLGGPPGPFLDLESSLFHEFGHALGWEADPYQLGFNPHYVALLSTTTFTPGQTVYLTVGSDSCALSGDGTGSEQKGVNDLSHCAPPLPGDESILMARPRPINDGSAVRMRPDPFTVEVVNAVHGAVHGAVPEPSTISLFASAGLLLGLRALWLRRRGS